MPSFFLNLEIPETAWKPVGQSNTENEDAKLDRLLATVVIAGSYHHLEAYRVYYDDADGMLKMKDTAMDKDLMPTLQRLHEGNYYTVTIFGHEYVLFMFPYTG